MLERREGREHLTVQEFLKVKKFNQELKTRQKSSTVGANPETYLSHVRAVGAGVERAVHLKRAISS